VDEIISATMEHVKAAMVILPLISKQQLATGNAVFDQG
jgi:hypothetical protein